MPRISSQLTDVVKLYYGAVSQTALRKRCLTRTVTLYERVDIIIYLLVLIFSAEPNPRSRICWYQIACVLLSGTCQKLSIPSASDPISRRKQKLVNKSGPLDMTTSHIYLLTDLGLGFLKPENSRFPKVFKFQFLSQFLNYSMKTNQPIDDNIHSVALLCVKYQLRPLCEKLNSYPGHKKWVIL